MLNDTCAPLGFILEDNDKSRPCRLRRQILQYLKGEDETLLEDGGISVLLNVNDIIDTMRKNYESDDEPHKSDDESHSNEIV